MSVHLEAEPVPRGDAAAFARWVAPSLVAMSRLARRLAPTADPDDIVQDSLTRAWRKLDSYDADRGTPTTWLLAITADQARSARRSRLRHLQLVDESAVLPNAASPPVAVERDLDVERAIGRLAERQQLAVHLHYFVGLSVEETAAVMQCAAGTVKSTLFDARSRLRTILGDDDD